jgi:preprotein translocase subunit SecD
MFDYPKWKYWIIAAVVLLSALYSLPNVFQSIPAVHVTAKKGSVVEASVKGTVEAILIGKAGDTSPNGEKIPVLGVDFINGRVVARFPDIEAQLKAADRLKQDKVLMEKYNASLNLFSTVPAWLKALHAKGMTLGLDLRGGVHFLMEVDEKTTRDSLDRRLIDSLYELFRRKEIGYSSVVREGDQLVATFVNAEEATKARAEIGRSITELTIADGGGSALQLSILPQIVTDALNQAVEQNTTTLRQRLGALAEPVVQRQGQSRIVVQLPGVQDTAEAKIIIGATASLEYRAVDEANNMRAAEIEQTKNVPAESMLFKWSDDRPILLKKAVIASGGELTGASVGIDPQSGEPQVSVTLTAGAGDRMLDFTTRNVGKLMAVVFIENVPITSIVDGKEVTTFEQKKRVISAATIRGAFGRSFQTTGLSLDEAKELSNSLKAGSLAAPMKFAQERVIGPSLGKKNILAGLFAVSASFVFVLIFFFVYYRTFGLITGAALIVNLLMVVAIMSLLGSTLTLPGLAGLALTIGMSVDANVLINERIREELRRGMSPLQAIDIGYDKASGTIWDANVTALLGGLALLAFGSGPIQGFAITLCLGILTSIYSAVSLSKGIAAFLYSGRKLTKLAI